MLHTTNFRTLRMRREWNKTRQGFVSCSLPSFCIKLSASIIMLLHQTWETVIRFCVNVPVLSVQIVEVDPSVSTAWRFFTKQFLEAILFAVSVKHTVTVGSSPSGTCATIKLITNTTESIHEYPRIKARNPNSNPKKAATIVMMLMKKCISFDSGVSLDSKPAARIAMRPIMVRSPVRTAIPLAAPEFMGAKEC